MSSLVSSSVSSAGSGVHAFATQDRDLIQASIDARVRAIRRKDVEAIVAHYADDVQSFDLVTPLANDGVDAIRERLTTWFASFATPIAYELRGIELAVAGEVAFQHHFVHVEGTSVAGDLVKMWFRETVGYRKVGGAWKVTHQHSSVPVDMKTMKGRMDLEPEVAGTPDADTANDARVSLHDPRDLVTIASFNDLPEAELARERLENEGVPSFVLHAGAAGTLPFLNASGVAVQVREADARRAHEILGSQAV